MAVYRQDGSTGQAEIGSPATGDGSSGARHEPDTAADRISSSSPLAQVRPQVKFKSQRPCGSRLSRLSHDLISAERVRCNLPASSPRRKPTLASGYQPPARLLAKKNLRCGDSYFLHVRPDGTEVRLKREPGELFWKTHYVTVIDTELDGTLVEEVELRGIGEPHGSGWSYHSRDFHRETQIWQRRRLP
jgi:hypothetical protein